MTLRVIVVVALAAVGCADLSVSTGGSCEISPNKDWGGTALCTWRNCPKASSAEECCSHCTNRPGCSAASLFQGTCYLKSNPTATTSKWGCTAVKTGASPTLTPAGNGKCSIEHNRDISGTDLCTWGNCPKASSAEECCSHCANRPGCSAASLFQGTCYLKSNPRATTSKWGCTVVKTGASPTPTLTPTPTPTPTPAGDGKCSTIEHDRDSMGMDLCNWNTCPKVSTAEECCERCANTECCDGASLFEGVCYMKSHVIGTTPKQGVTAVKIERKPNPTLCPVPAPSGMNIRVAKALGSRGYDKVRISLISYSSAAQGAEALGQEADEVSLENSSLETESVEALEVGENVKWSYEGQFQHRWTGNHIKSAVVQVTPGTAQNFNVEGHTLRIRIPKEDEGSVGMFVADPCIRYSAQWCKYVNEFEVQGTLQKVVNGLAARDELDYWFMIGDNFYDQKGDTTKDFFKGLSMTAAGKIHAMTLGNHDFWVGGHPPGNGGDSFGNGHMQWSAQDAMSAKDDESRPFDYSRAPMQIADKSNFFWYNKIGNAAFIAFSQAHEWWETEPYFKEACAWVQKTKPALLMLLGHWNGDGMGCKNGMNAKSAYLKLRNIAGCSEMGSRLKYVTGHEHCNKPLGGDGFLLGSFGFAGCGNFGIPIVDTRGGRAKLLYFSMGEHGRKNRDFHDVVGCLQTNGVSGCKQHAQTWMDESLPASPWNNEILTTSPWANETVDV